MISFHTSYAKVDSSSVLEAIKAESSSGASGYYKLPFDTLSVVDLSVNLSKPTSKDELNALFAAQAKAKPQIFHIDNDQCVSSDFIGSPYSAIIVPDKTMVLHDRFAKILAWYDNEFGYTTRLVDMAAFVLER